MNTDLPADTMHGKVAAGSQQDRIRAALLDELERGLLVPGAAVDEKSLADRFGVSRTPVREALLALAAHQLVRIVPRSGIHIHAPSPTELVGMLEALSEMEAVVVRLATQRMAPLQREGLHELCVACEAAASVADRFAYESANERFHEALYAGCGNDTILEQVRLLRMRLAAFRRRVRDQPGRLQSSAAEHRLVVEGVLRSDVDAASQAMREHIQGKGRAFADLLLSSAAGSRSETS